MRRLGSAVLALLPSGGLEALPLFWFYQHFTLSAV